MSPMLLLIPILLPILFGALLPLFRFERKQREPYVMAVVVLNTLITYYFILTMPVGESVTLVHLTESLHITLHMDGMSKVFAGLVAGMWPLASLYAFEYMRHEGKENTFFAFYTMTFGVTVGIACSANIMTMYFFYELLTLVTLPIVMHTMDHRSIRAGIKYLKYSIGGAAFAFMGFVLLHYAADSCDFTFGGILTDQGLTPENSPVLLIAYVMMFFGFGVKAAVFPFHGWLPSAGVAPTPVTALLHAVAVVKAGVFAIIRVTYYSFGTAFLAETWAQYVPLAFVIITIVFGSVMAVKEQHLKRRLAYSTVSNLSYILFGAMLLTEDGLAAGLIHMIFHGVMKIVLFYCAGAIMHQTGCEYIYEVNGFGKKMKKIFAIYTVGSLALVGVPPLTGFVSKWYLLEAGVKSGARYGVGEVLPVLSFLGVAALLISALLTAIYLFTIMIRAYFPDMLPHGAVEVQEEVNEEPAVDAGHGGHHAKVVEDPNWYMILPMTVFAVAAVVFGLIQGEFMDFFRQIAQGLL